MPIIAAIILFSGIIFVGYAANSFKYPKVNTPTPPPHQEAQVVRYTPTPSAIPILSPPPSRVKGTTTQSTQKDDPIVDCGTDYQRQKGISTSKVKKSTCDSWVDCQMDLGVTVRVPKEKCDALYNCQLGDRVVKSTSKEQCEEFQRQIAGKRQSQQSINEEVKKQLHEKNLRDAEQELLQRGLTREEIDAELHRLDETLKAQGL